MVRDDERSVPGPHVARRYAKRWKAGPRRHPRMPAGPWWCWAVVSVAAGAALSWAVSQSEPTATIVVRTVLGGVFGLAIGMWIVESAWARWFDRPEVRPPAAHREELP